MSGLGVLVHISIRGEVGAVGLVYAPSDSFWPFGGSTSLVDIFYFVYVLVVACGGGVGWGGG